MDENRDIASFLKDYGQGEDGAPALAFDQADKAADAIDYEDISDDDDDLPPDETAAEPVESPPDELEMAQFRLFALAARKAAGEEVEEEEEEIDMNTFYALFPRFETHQNPIFTEIFPPRSVNFRGKEPPKPPKPVLPTKLSLDVLPDQARAFKSFNLSNKTPEELRPTDSLVYLDTEGANQGESDDDLNMGPVDEHEMVGNVTMQDLEVLCADWDLPSLTSSRATSPENFSDGEYEWERTQRPRKKQKTEHVRTDFVLSFPPSHENFGDPERSTAKIAQAVTLDMNDPNLLLETLDPRHTSRKRTAGHDRHRCSSSKRDLLKRYNISNDDAYNLLKENHQFKTRSTLMLSVDHSMPATRLQYPFYKIRLDNRQKRAFHRPHLELRDARDREMRISKPKHVKRKHLKGRGVKDLFAKAEDLSLGDNAPMLLLEYSEEAPTMLCNFGMGNRLVNYYRKKGAEDTDRPRREIGDTQVLLTQDESPFKHFGHVDPGEVVPTIQNGLFRAPVFGHTSRSTDFVVGVSTTFHSGPRLYLRNVQNLHTVGQQLPLVPVPGAHSRKVTDAAKKRLRAISYRIHHKSVDPYRTGKPKLLTNEALVAHLPGTDVAQNRQKMRDFMKYDKPAGKDAPGVWAPIPGQPVPDEETLRSWIKPEDVCTLDSMQMGVQHLADLGVGGSTDVIVNDDHDAGEDANIELQLAPWQTTKNFMAATAGNSMLKIHGDGDPTGCGEGLSFIKTSMKGGFRPLGESVEDKLQAKKRRDAGGHSYNVEQQKADYAKAIRTIWEKQKQSLSAGQETSETEDDEEARRRAARPTARHGAPRLSSLGIPAGLARPDDDEASQISAGGGPRISRVLEIRRRTKDKYGNDQVIVERVTNPRVINLYKKRRIERDLSKKRYSTHSPFPLRPPRSPVPQFHGLHPLRRRRAGRRRPRPPRTGIRPRQPERRPQKGPRQGQAPAFRRRRRRRLRRLPALRRLPRRLPGRALGRRHARRRRPPPHRQGSRRRHRAQVRQLRPEGPHQDQPQVRLPPLAPP